MNDRKLAKIKEKIDAKSRIKNPIDEKYVAPKYKSSYFDSAVEGRLYPEYRFGGTESIHTRIFDETSNVDLDAFFEKIKMKAAARTESAKRDSSLVTITTEFSLHFCHLCKEHVYAQDLFSGIKPDVCKQCVEKI